MRISFYHFLLRIDDLKLTPDELDIPIPKYFKSDRKRVRDLHWVYAYRTTCMLRLIGMVGYRKMADLSNSGKNYD